MAKEIVNDGDSGLSARTKWNDNFTETYRTLIKEEKTADFTVENGGRYLVDASGGPIIATLGTGVDIFAIGDFEDTWDNTNTVSVVIGTDTLLFDKKNTEKEYVINKEGSTYRCYNEGKFIIAGNI